MALSNNIVNELRPGSGADTNGGGFVTGSGGTDRSQQNGAFVTFDGATIFATTSGTSATILITGYAAVAGDKGNLVRISGGTNFTPGLYQVTSVSAGVSGVGTWTLDRNCSSGAGLAMTGAMGGALATLGQFFTDANVNTALGGSIGGNVCWMKGTQTITTSIAVSGPFNQNAGGGSGASGLTGVQVIGYNSSRGDNGQATITTATNSVDLLHFANNSRNITFANINFTTSAGTVAIGCTNSTNSSAAAGIFFDSCTWNGFTQAIFADTSSNGGVFVPLTLRNCEIKNCTTTAAIINNGGTWIIDCYIHGNTGDGVRMTSGAGYAEPLVLIRSIFYANTATGVNYQGNANTQGSIQNYTTAVNCCFVSNTTDGFKTAVSGSNGVCEAILENNIFYGNGGWGVNLTVLAGAVIGGFNAFGSNVSGTYTGGFTGFATDVTLSGDPFNGRTSNDFSLNNTAGAGAACRQAGFPGVLNAGGTGFADIGPLSPQSTGGSTTIVIGRNVTTFLGEQGDF